MADVLRTGGRDPDGDAKGLSVTEEGHLKVEQHGNNVLLAEGQTPLEVDIPTENINSVLVSVENGTNTDILSFQTLIDGTWYPWKDGFGDDVTLPLTGSGVYGPFQGFPSFEKGRIFVDSVNVARDKAYYTNTEDENHEDLAHRAWNEDSAHPNQGLKLLPIVGTYTSVDLGSEMEVTIVSMWGRDGTSTVNEFSIDGTNESIDAVNENWTRLLTANLERNDTMQSFNLEVTGSYRYYRMYVHTNHGAVLDSWAHDIRLYDAPPIFNVKLLSV